MDTLTVKREDALYMHWLIPISIIVLLFFITLMSGKRENFNLDTIKREVKIAYQTSNPQIQYSVNPVPYLIDFLQARSYYPNTLPRRPDSIVNPMKEGILRADSVENTGNLPSMYTPPYSGPEISGVYRAYRYPHNDLHYPPWGMSIGPPYLDYNNQQGNGS